MKTVYISHTGAAFGASRSLAALVKGAAKTGTAFLIHPPALDNFERLFSDQVRRAEIPLPWTCLHSYEWRPRVLFRHVKAMFSTWNKMKQFAGDLGDAAFVHSNSVVIPWGAVLARRLKVPHIWHVREFGDLDYGLTWLLPKAVLKLLLRKADRVICISQAVARHFDLEDAPNMRVLYNGVMEASQMRVLPKNFPGSEPLRFGSVGFLSEGKGFDGTIRAFAKYRQGGGEGQLLIFGEGADHVKRSLEALANELEVSESVQFMGFVDSSEAIYASVDALVVNSRNEAFGRVTAEAMAYGVPVIGRRTGGTAELISDGVTGLLFNNEEELSQRMLTLEKDPGLRGRLSEAGLEHAKKHFTVEGYVAGFRDIVDEVVNG